ncbi:uncharacterized protein BJ171DRAFT_617223 [Polychytrium aggregatum]|uniref:uncharacterized protein n=1 Tax=Polychytrium aggregatum TaxID=110093 RepID=UPI0022FF337D|nr:uncharacterized protein BJ171DRAFT_617223 [Polychytrium aggregatum]KAI9190592.1 hypothetical protein BJ171DRAFT_617223 [Polychytrium aggregatum]
MNNLSTLFKNPSCKAIDIDDVDSCDADIESAFSFLEDQSRYFADLDDRAPSSAQRTGSTLKINIDCSVTYSNDYFNDVIIVNIPSESFTGIDTFIVNNLAICLQATYPSILVFNVGGQNVTIQSFDMEILRPSATRIIWNIFEASNIQFALIAVHGTILAPFADITAEGVIYGSVLAQSFTGPSQVNKAPLNACQSIAPTNSSSTVSSYGPPTFTATTFLQGNSSLSSNWVCEGRLAIGGNLSSSLLSVGSSLYGGICHSCADVTAWIKSQYGSSAPAILSNAAIVNGYVTSGIQNSTALQVTNGYFSSPNAPGNGVQVAFSDCKYSSGTVLDFQYAFQYLKNISLALKAQPVTASVTLTGTVLTISIPDGCNVAVAQVDISVLSSATSLVINNHHFFTCTGAQCANATLIINVAGASASINSLTMTDLNGVDGQVIFNFYEATNIAISATDFVGMVLAPNATVTQASGSLTGNLYALSVNVSNSVYSAFRFKYSEFKGCIPRIRSSPPTSSPGGLSGGAIAAVVACGVVAAGGAAAAGFWFMNRATVAGQALSSAPGALSGASLQPALPSPDKHWRYKPNLSRSKLGVIN